MNGQTQWLPGLSTLAAGTIASVLYLLWSRRSTLGQQRRASTPPPSTSDYEQKIDQLRAHQANRHLFSAEVWEEEQQRLESAAVAALAAAAPPAPTAPTPVPSASAPEQEPRSHRSSAFIGALVGGSVVALAVFLSHQLNRHSVGQAPDVRAQPPSDAASEKAERALLDTLREAQQHPDDIRAVLAAAQALVWRGEMEEATPYIQRANALDPFDVSARAYRLLLQHPTRGDAATLDLLEKLALTYGDAPEAWLYAGSLRLKRGEGAAALVHFRTFQRLVASASWPPMLESTVRSLEGAPPAPEIP